MDLSDERQRPVGRVGGEHDGGVERNAVPGRHETRADLDPLSRAAIGEAERASSALAGTAAKPAKKSAECRYRSNRRTHMGSLVPASSVRATKGPRLGAPKTNQVAGVPVYKGDFGEAEATRLLWRAGFGPRPGEAAKLARHYKLKGAVHSLTRPRGPEVLKGPEPVDDDGLPIAPFDAWGHDLLWWLDRMVRTNHPLIERMALIWHDWFATADVNSQQLSVEQAQLFEQQGLGSFADLLLSVTTNPAMLIWLSGIDNAKRAPNENYGREMMELFTLGASDDSGYPYSEDDVREQARALTGWRATWVDDVGPDELPLRPHAPRHRHEDDLRPDRSLRLQRLGPPLRHPRRAQGVLHRQALELLRARRRRRPRPVRR